MRARFYPLRDLPGAFANDDFGQLLERIGLVQSRTEVEVLRYETDASGVRWAYIKQPYVENSIVGILCKQEGRSLPPPQLRRVRASLLEEIT